jgi:hypothetical protein
LPAKHNLAGMQLTHTYYVNQVLMPPKRQEKTRKKSQKPCINPEPIRDFSKTHLSPRAQIKHQQTAPTHEDSPSTPI